MLFVVGCAVLCYSLHYLWRAFRAYRKKWASFGLRWVDVGVKMPQDGDEITSANPKLVEALKRTSTFTRPEFSELRVRKLRLDCFVRCNKRYYVVADPNRIMLERHGRLDYDQRPKSKIKSDADDAVHALCPELQWSRD